MRTTFTVSSSSSTASASARPPKLPPSFGCYPNQAATEIPRANATAAQLKKWWCDPTTEYGFQGYSYSVLDCPTSDVLVSDFTAMATQYGARYSRIYGDQCSWYDTTYIHQLVDAAVQAKLGLYLSVCVVRP